MQKLSIAIAAAAIAFAAPASATGVIKCNAGPQAKWKSMEDLTAKLKKEGWQVRKVKVDGGCYEAYGTTPKGERVEAYFHPVSLKTLFIGRRGQVLFREKGY
jgi:hypothetical protein